MLDQTAAALAEPSRRLQLEELYIRSRDRRILGELARQVAELAARPQEQAKADLWYRHNALEATRPLVFCDPENGWNEIVRARDLQCQGTLARQWEMTLRKEVYWGAEMGDDRVVNQEFIVSHVYTESDWGMHETRIGGEGGGAYTWDAPLKSYRDLRKLHAPRIAVDQAATKRLVELAQSVFDPILPVRLKTSWWWSLGMTWPAINLRGLEQFMLDMIDHPNELGRLMGTLRDGTLAKLDFLEANGLLSLNNDNTYVGSGGFGFTRELPPAGFSGTVRTCDMWGFLESQETVAVSPAMFDEFVFRYQLPILERFGLNCYGCCEPLDRRWEVVKRAPRLRRVSVSPWANLADMAEKLGDGYIFSLKPSPSPLAAPTFDQESIRASLREAMRLTRDCRVEVIMKDNHTIANDPSRVVRWVQIAREEAESL